MNIGKYLPRKNIFVLTESTTNQLQLLLLQQENPLIIKNPGIHNQN